MAIRIFRRTSNAE